ncbi:hypothetical protein M9Y10_045135 [Tritrichomonas musculus]|uniref:Uncharacterized protein n=1 Tax=Tritrichomonas musculus TaxID=1915356 RepID=A0ABR2JV55_9EUKA
MIRTGRPVFHIKAQWISYDGPDGIEYYKLDSRGNLIKKDGKIQFKYHNEIDEKDQKKLKKKISKETKKEEEEFSFDLYDSYPDCSSGQFDSIFDDLMPISLGGFDFDDIFL